MDKVEAKLQKMGHRLPKLFAYPSPNRTGCIRTGNLLYLSGHPPPADFGVMVHGKVGSTVTEAEAVASAQATALCILSSVKHKLGSLERVSQVVKINGMVNSAPGFQSEGPRGRTLGSGIEGQGRLPNAFSKRAWFVW